MSNTTTQHTPTPWRVIEGSLIKQDYRHIGLGESAGVLIGRACGHPSSGFYPTDEEGAANAAFIVRACNSHDQLVAALEMLLDQIEEHRSLHGRQFDAEAMGHAALAAAGAAQ